MKHFLIFLLYNRLRMKIFAPLLLFIMLPACCLHAREIKFANVSTANIPGTLCTEPGEFAPAIFSSEAFLAHRRHHPRDPMVKTGAIVAITGGGLFLGGIWTLILFGTGDDHQAPNKSATNAGLGLMAAGAALAITGGIVAKIGHNRLYRYGWQLITPKSNEIGIAYRL